ncbi:MAG: hypothetical protein AAGH90_04020 [Pseudomonadota bacterium]
MNTWQFDHTSPAGVLILGVAAGLIVVLICTLYGPARTLSIRLIAFLQSIANSILGNEVIRVFADKGSAQKYLEKDFRKSSKVFLITGRGNQLQTEPPFAYLFIDRNPQQHSMDVKILLPVDNPKSDHTNWTAINEVALSSIDNAYNHGAGTLAKQIASSAQTLDGYKKSGHVTEVRRFNMPHFARIIITDSGVYMSPYNEEKINMKHKILKFRKGCEVARLWERLFWLLWNNPHPNSEPD